MDTVELWVNPTLGGTLGTADASISGGDFAITCFNTRPDTANVFIFDELRIGESYADVTPYTVIPEPTTWALLAGSLTALVVFRRRRQS